MVSEESLKNKLKQTIKMWKSDIKDNTERMSEALDAGNKKEYDRLFFQISTINTCIDDVENILN